MKLPSAKREVVPTTQRSFSLVPQIPYRVAFVGEGWASGCGSHAAQLSLLIGAGPGETRLRSGASDNAMAWL